MAHGQSGLVPLGVNRLHGWQFGIGVIAAVFFAGVRVGSLSPWKLPSKKWGNAWYDQAGYRSLSEDELAELKAEVEKLDLPQDIRIQYLSEIERRVTEN